MNHYSEDDINKALNILCKSERLAIKNIHNKDEILAPKTSPNFDEFETGLASTRILESIKKDDNVENPGFFKYKKALLLSLIDEIDSFTPEDYFYENHPDTQIRELIGLIKNQSDWNKGIDSGAQQSYINHMDAILVSKPSEELVDKVSEIFLGHSETLNESLRETVGKFPEKISRKHISQKKEQATYSHEITHRYVHNRVEGVIPEVDEGFAHTVSEYIEPGNISDKKALVGYAKRGYDVKKISLVIMMAKNKLSHMSKNKDFKFLDWIRKEEVRIINDDAHSVEDFLQEFNPRRYAKLEELNQMEETRVKETYEELKPVILEINYRDLLENSQVSAQRLQDELNELEQFLENPDRQVLNRSIEVISEIKDNVLHKKKVENPEALPLRRTFDNIMEDVMEEQLEKMFNLESDLRSTAKVMHANGREEHAEKLLSAANEISELEKDIKNL